MQAQARHGPESEPAMLSLACPMIAPAISTAWAFSAGGSGASGFSASLFVFKIRTMVAMDLIYFSKFPAPVVAGSLLMWRFLAG